MNEPNPPYSESDTSKGSSNQVSYSQDFDTQTTHKKNDPGLDQNIPSLFIESQK